jgi:CxxC motif-containing protein (DUF1111 family)
MNRYNQVSYGLRIVGLGGGVAAVVAAVGFAQAGPPPVGGPLPGLTTIERSQWEAGLNALIDQEDPVDGLGPVFNARSCVACHRAGAPGGAGTDLAVSRVTRIGAIVNGVYSDLPNLGGPLLQVRSLREIDPNYPFPGERIPLGTQFVSRRITTPLFGAGLIEAIPWQTIYNRSLTTQPDNIRGAVHWVTNPETNGTEIGRFGWKAQVSNLHVFAGDAYQSEMGVTSRTFPKDSLPQGRLDPAGADKVADPEDGTDDVRRLTNFMRLTSPPPQVPFTTQALRGQQVFASIRCTSCHVPQMQTGTNAIVALSSRPVRLYSDLLIHRMGPGLNDGVRQGRAAGDQWRTAPLWGLRFRRSFLHDGRAATPEQAILMHGGAGQLSRDRYSSLPLTDRAALLDFLNRI